MKAETVMTSIVGSAKPVWLKAVMVREGDDVVTRCCVVTEGQFFPIEVRVNVPKLIATLQQLQKLGLGPQGSDAVGGFGSWLKKAVKKVTHNKVTRAVGSVVSKVVKSPIVQIANPAFAITAHTLSKAATGKGTIKGAAGKLVDAGTAAVTKVVPIPSAMSFIGPKATAAFGVGLKAVTTARAAGVIGAVAKKAQAEVNLGKSAANALLGKTAQNPAQARALVQRAVAVRSNVQKLAPQLAKQVVASAKVKASFAQIAAQAKAGSADALLAARVIARSSQALDQVQRLQQSIAGGVAGLLLTADGRIVKAPRGLFLQRSAVSSRPDTLYRGAKTASLKGSFSAVAGTKMRMPRTARYHHPEVSTLKQLLAECTKRNHSLYTEITALESRDGRSVIDVGASPSWGGDLDPGNDIDGPLHRLDHPDGRVLLDDYSSVAGAWTP